MKTKLIFILLLFAGSSCKNDFLDIRPNKSLLVPTTTTDIQALLDNISVMNNVTGLNMFAADEFAITDAGLDRATANIRTAYLWLRDNYQGTAISDWNQQYEQVFYSNVALEANQKLKGETSDILEGAALFYRAMAMFNLSQLFTKPYSKDNLNAPGLPYPKSADINLRPQRGTLKALYENILADLNVAEQLLPTKTTTKNRPNQQACYALLARIYLVMMDYHKAELFADKALQAGNTLLDFNIGIEGFFPFGEPLPNGIAEVIYYQRRYAYAVFNYGAITIDPSLEVLFAPNDLRRNILFTSAGGNFVYFTGYEGLTTSECYLIKAECLARTDKVPEAMLLLNQLVEKRFKTGSFISLAAQNKQEALVHIINERRKDLFGRGTRWSDLRRFNQDPNFVVTLTRISKNVTYTLTPHSDEYVFKIPDQEIAGNDIEQN